MSADVWEFRTETLNNMADDRGGTILDREGALNKLGAIGWELVAAVSANSNGTIHTLYFKRPRRL
jgi:hypothetical protein